jgi:hypothetical protein
MVFFAFFDYNIDVISLLNTNKWTKIQKPKERSV